MVGFRVGLGVDSSFTLSSDKWPIVVIAFCCLCTLCSMLGVSLQARTATSSNTTPRVYNHRYGNTTTTNLQPFSCRQQYQDMQKIRPTPRICLAPSPHFTLQATRIYRYFVQQINLLLHTAVPSRRCEGYNQVTRASSQLGRTKHILEHNEHSRRDWYMRNKTPSVHRPPRLQVSTQNHIRHTIMPTAHHHTTTLSDTETTTNPTPQPATSPPTPPAHHLTTGSSTPSTPAWPRR